MINKPQNWKEIHRSEEPAVELIIPSSVPRIEILLLPGPSLIGRSYFTKTAINSPSGSVK